MATNLLPIQATGVRASAVSGHRISENRRLKTSTTVPTTTTTTNGNWWNPLFGWSADADYIDSNKKEDLLNAVVRSEKKPDPEPNRSRSRFAPGCFTEEKAKQLRMMTMETASFHDAMYHSAIASRLASDFTGHSG